MLIPNLQFVDSLEPILDYILDVSPMHILTMSESRPHDVLAFGRPGSFGA